MQYSKQEVLLEKSDIKAINTLTGLVKLIQIVAAILLGITAIIVPLVIYQILGWSTTLIIESVLIASMFLAFYLIKVKLIQPFKNEINNGIKFEHRGTLTNKRDEMVYSRENGKNRIIQTFFITLNEIEIRIGDIDNFNNLKLYESLQLNKNYRVSQSVRDAYVIFNLEEII